MKLSYSNKENEILIHRHRQTFDFDHNYFKSHI